MAVFEPENIVTMERIEEWMPGDERIIALRQVYERALQAFDGNHRVKNALLLILNGHVLDMYSDPKEHIGSPEWVFKIKSQTNPNVVFTVTKDKCNCVDNFSKVNRGYCKHRICRAIVLRTQQVLAWRTRKETV